MRLASVLLLLGCASPRSEQASIWNGDVPVEVSLPAGVDVSKPEKLVVFSKDQEVPAQFVDGKAVFLAHDQDGPFHLRSGSPKEFPKVEVRDVDGKHLVVSYEGKTILRYNYATIKPPEGVDPVFERSGYIHPIWTPSGKVVTNDSPKNHLHHHGLWWAWTSSSFEGRKSNFWESAAREGRIECVRVEKTISGPVFGGFRVRHRFVNLNAPGGPKNAIDEIWDVRVWATAHHFLFDLVSIQSCATDQPLVIRVYRYGGLGFRGSSDWEGNSGAAFLTSEGKSRKDGHATMARWCVMSGKVRGAECSVGFLCHPANFRYPQPMRIHPDEPFFNWAVPQAGDFSIEPGKPYVSRYRFVVADGPLGADVMDRLHRAYAEPPVLALHLSK